MTASSRHASTGRPFPFSLERERRQQLDGDGVADEAVGGVAHEHLTGVGDLLEPGRHVDHVPEGEIQAAGRLGDHDLAGVDAGPQVEAHPPPAAQLGVELTEARVQLGRGAHCAQRVVLADDGNAEQRHHGIPDELLHVAAVPLQGGRGVLVVAGHHLPQDLRVQPLPEAGGVDHVGEDRGHDLAYLPARDRRERPPAPHAEAPAVGIVFPALRAPWHRPSVDD
ncbi:MAG TPA: hypothetical protein VKP11_09365 [Frankiaceae bacterium]|nr:hypothetical protein [Frankiaceae bacterium]